MTVYDFTVKTPQGEDATLSSFSGKVLLIVNTATKCGLTPQYKELQALYEKYKENGFEILDFPSNQFLKQAPGTDAEISVFCNLNYGTTFPRFAKVDVNGNNALPLYAWLKEQAPIDQGDEDSASFEKKVSLLTPFASPDDVKWNFGKFLIDRSGNVSGRFSPAYKPEQLTSEIENLLKQEIR